ncbi:hypothetical protein E2562_015203 [Oryza meyeriana var. granulata]|uniref:Uncharacterized protein n=1 Tax=Oryza meyeriana var. granulata TaxID=110450 RepID=A0A6G1EWR1_9ORYZ|nr:hypothetical protein E2562_015203 [Oryza meyeriana var. granulata]
MSSPSFSSRLLLHYLALLPPLRQPLPVSGLGRPAAPGLGVAGSEAAGGGAPLREGGGSQRAAKGRGSGQWIQAAGAEQIW